VALAAALMPHPGCGSGLTPAPSSSTTIWVRHQRGGKRHQLLLAVGEDAVSDLVVFLRPISSTSLWARCSEEATALRRRRVRKNSSTQVAASNCCAAIARLSRATGDRDAHGLEGPHQAGARAISGVRACP